MLATTLTLMGTLPGFWRVENQTMPLILIVASLTLIIVLMFGRKPRSRY
jgi:hypothetical protein